jgi:predicted dehydrogenase
LKNTGAKIIGICDIDEVKARETSRRFGIEKCYTDPATMLAECNLDVVHAVTPPASHAPLAIQAMEAGCHVLVEKPMALSAEEADQMISVARRTGRKLCVDHNHLFDPIVLQAKDYLSAGALGRLVGFDFFQGFGLRFDQSAGSTPQERWFSSLPYGAVQDLAPHSLAFLLDFIGVPQTFSVSAKASGQPCPSPFDEVRMLAEGKEILGSCTISLNTQPYLERLTLYGSEMTLEANLNSMTLIKRNKERRLPKPIRRVLPNLEESFQLLSSTAMNTGKYLLGKIAAYPGVGELIRRFYQSIESGGESPVTVAQGREVVRLMDIVREETAKCHPCASL